MDFVLSLFDVVGRIFLFVAEVLGAMLLAAFLGAVAGAVIAIVILVKRVCTTNF